MPITSNKNRTINLSTYQPWFIIGLVCLFCLTSCNNNEAEDHVTVSNKAKIEVTEDGFYQITEKVLANADLQFDSFTANTLVLTTQGQSVPFYFDDNGLVFYGQAPTSRYTASRPYILTVGDTGTLMQETTISSLNSLPNLTSVSKSIHLEENHLYESQARAYSEDDVWFWETIRQGQSFPIAFDLSTVADGSGEITMQLVGVSYNAEIENDHDFDVIINEIPIGTIQFDGETVYTATLDIPTSTLITGKNELILDNSPEGAAFLDIMQLNWIDINYNAPTTAVNDQLIPQPTEGQITTSGFSDAPLLFNITNPATPQQVTDPATNEGEFQLPLQPEKQIAAIGPDGYTTPFAISPLRESNLRNTSQQADLIILTTDELAPTLEPLVQARTEEGLSVKLVPVEEVYDEFGGGEASPDSLNQFVTYAYNQWQAPQARYLLLVGDATSDYHDYLSMAPQNIVPAPMVPVSFSGETVSDSILADTDGDGAPNMAVGRWPVNTTEEASSLVERTLAYEQGTAVNNAFFAADGTEPQFERMAQAIATNSHLPSESLQVLPSLQADEVTAILNEGTWLTTYVGHGSLRQWGKDDVFTQAAIANLETETPPIILQLTCLTGLFTQPEQTSLTETLLNDENGPVLSVAATSLTLSANQEPFATSLIQHLNDPSVVRMGDAFQTAKLSLDIGNDGLREISDTFALFGDPSARIVRPES